jgi:hypothetical protein
MVTVFGRIMDMGVVYVERARMVSSEERPS